MSSRLPLLAFVIVFLGFLPFASIGVDPHHDGIMLKPALDVLSGQTLFRDTFSQYGALTTYLHVMAFLVLGRTLIAIKWLTVFFYALTAGALTWVWGMIMPRPLVLVSLLLWMGVAPFLLLGWPMLPWSSVPAIFFQTLALGFLICSLTTSGRLAALLAGAMAALVFWCRMPVGLCLETGLILVYGLNAFRNRSSGLLSPALRLPIYALLGFAAASVPFAMAIYLSGATSAWYEQNFVWPGIWAKSVGTDAGTMLRALFVYDDPSFKRSHFGIYRIFSVAAFAAAAVFPVIYSRLAPKRLYAIEAALFVLAGALEWEFFHSIEGWAAVVPPILLALTLAEIWRAESMIAVAVGVICTASWAQFYPVPDPRHLYWALSPAIGGFFYLLSRRAAGFNPKHAAVGLMIFILPLLASRAVQIKTHLRGPFQGFAAPLLAGMRGMRLEAEMADEVWRAIEQESARNPKIPMLLESPDSLYASFVPNLTNYDPFFVSWVAMKRGPEDALKRRKFISENRPLIFFESAKSPEINEYALRFGYDVRSFKIEKGILLTPRSPLTALR